MAEATVCWYGYMAGLFLSGRLSELDEMGVARLLASCGRRTNAGRRDFAILTVLTRLGLRAKEVAVLSIDDVNWRAGELTVHGKDNRRDRLPLPVDVGQAVAGHCRRGRPGMAAGRYSCKCGHPMPRCHRRLSVTWWSGPASGPGSQRGRAPVTARCRHGDAPRGRGPPQRGFLYRLSHRVTVGPS